MNERRDDIERRLRASLEARADDLAPTPVLWQKVEQHARRRRWTVRLTATATAAAAVVAMVVMVPVFLDNDPGPVIDDPPETVVTPDPDTSPGPGGTGDGDPDAVIETIPVTVFFARNDETTVWIEPEVHDIDAETEATARAAMEILLGGEPRNPDLFSSAPEGVSVLATNIRDGVLIVDLSGEVVERGMGSTQEASFAQQLAHTAASFDGVSAVQVYVEGEPITDPWGHFDWSEPIEPEPAILSPITIDEPRYGASVGTGEVTFSGDALVMFEATFQVRLFGPDGELRHEDFAMTDDAFERRPWSYTFTITEPGVWTFEAEEDDPSGGEGRPPLRTSVTFEVETDPEG